MSTIWKYQLKVVDKQVIGVPFGSYPLSVGVQNNNPMLWVMVVDPSAKKIQMPIITIGTGNPITEMIEAFIGTYQVMVGEYEFVGHVFRGGNK